MAEDFKQGGGFKKQMFDVSDKNIKCCDCGAEIKQLPFNPDPERVDSIKCFDCIKKSRGNNPR